MQRIPAIDPEHAIGRARILLDRIQMRTGLVSNQMKTMAVSPAVLEAYLDFDRALAGGILSPRLRERIALTVAEVRKCEYSLAVHCALGRAAGLSAEEIQDSRRGVSPDRKLEAALQFARQIVETHGRVTGDSLTRLGRLGYDHGEVVEMVANVILAIFTNYFHIVAGTVRDFPKASGLTLN